MAFSNPRFAALLVFLLFTLSAATDTYVSNHLSFNPQEEQDIDNKYLKAHITTAIKQVKDFQKNVVEKRLDDPTTGDSAKKCMKVCKEVYGNAVDALKKSLDSLSEGNFFKANMDLSAFTTNIETCDDCFGEFEKFDKWAKGIGGNCLDRIAKYTVNN